MNSRPLRSSVLISPPFAAARPCVKGVASRVYFACLRPQMYAVRRCDVTLGMIAMTPLSTHLDFQFTHIPLWRLTQDLR